MIGDFNLDFHKWGNPEQQAIYMTDLIKMNLETRGFVQTVEGITRHWPHTTSSLIDHCWTNCPERLLKSSNTTRGSSDHNIQEFSIRINGKDNKIKESIFRDKSKMNEQNLKMKMAAVDWT